MPSSANSHKLSIIESIFSDKDLITFVGAKYNCSIIHCQLIKPLVSTTYMISTSENRYILRIYPHNQSSAIISSELDALLFLHQKGVSVSVPQSNADGKYLTPIEAPEGERIMVLFSFAEGKPLAKVGNEIHFREFGRLVGLIHNLMDSQAIILARPALDKAVLVEEPLAYIAQLYADCIYELNLFNKIADSALLKLEKLPTHNFHYGFCHADLNSFNVHVSPKGVLTLFDFEYCGIGWQVYDIATFMNVESGIHADLFLQGYQDARLLTEDEKQYLPLFQIIQKIWMLGAGAKVMHTMGTFMFTESLFRNTLDSIRNYQNMLE